MVDLHILNFIFLPGFFASCIDPCQERIECESFLDSCGINTAESDPGPNHLLTSLTVPLNYHIHFEIKTNAFDPCAGMTSCTTLVGPSEIAPARDTFFANVSAAVNYRFSADVYCDHGMELNGYKNIIHVTAGGNNGNMGDRTFKGVDIMNC